MKLYAKVKLNGKWTMVSAGSVEARLQAHRNCECRTCNPDWDPSLEEE